VQGEKCEKIFLVLLSAFTAFNFYILLSSNGFILGNDPAVHMSKAYEILKLGRVSFSEIAWYPPLYRILLAEYMIFTGASDFESVLLLAKFLTIAFDWLLVFSVYLLGKKLVNRDVGVIASSLILLCFPLYEINFWGGYPSLLTIVYICLLLFYLPTKREGFVSKLITFVIAFCLVLTHHFATFLAIAVLTFYALVMLLVFRRSLKFTFIAAGLGMLAAFILWYVPIILPYINVFISHTFFNVRTYLNLTWRVSFDVFIMSFGFIILFAFLGVLLTFYISKEKEEMEYYTLLCLSFLIPLFFSQSYFFGVLLPYDRFVYYLMPPAVVFAAAATYLAVRYAVSCITKVDLRIPKYRLKAIVIASLVILLLASRFPVLTGKVCEAVDYYSYLDHQSYNAGVWLKNAYPHEAKLIVSEKPGLFFGIVSDKPTIMETSPVVQREAVAEVILTMAYEMEHPLTLFRVYEFPMPYERDQYNVLINNIWRRAAFLFDEETSVSYTRDGKLFSMKISDLERRIFWKVENGCRKLQIQYSFKNEFLLTESVEARNNQIPMFVDWVFTPLSGGIENLKFNLSIHFDLYRSFEKAYIPGILNWESPWNKPSFVERNRKWALVDFNPKNLSKNYVAVYDPLNRIFYAFKFENYPEWGSIGVLSTNQIDALRLMYSLNNVDKNVSLSYSIVAFSEESFRKIDFNSFDEVFTLNIINNFTVQYRDYLTCAREEGIKFLVFDRDKFRNEFLNNGFLQLVYSNNRYVLCKIKEGL
jgi:hypothetical protein